MSTLAYLRQRVPHWDAFKAQLRRVGGCEHPIRVTGRKDLVNVTTGEVTELWSSADLPDGTALIACGNRRASRCAPCSRLYQGDAYQLITAGLRGGKGVSEKVAGHPALFATFTAPSFGPVHTRVLSPNGTVRPCRAAVGVCAHGRPAGCAARHEAGDPLLGQALCAGCFDSDAAVLWNHHVPELWRRTRIAITRQLARLLKRTHKRVAGEVRVEYVKVAEYQRRGLLHYHAAIRLDAAGDPTLDPPGEYTADLLAQAIRAAVARVEAPYPQTLLRRLTPPGDAASTAGATVRDGSRRRLRALDLADRPAMRAARWGAQLHLDAIVPDLAQETVGPLSRGQVAGYLAKYATKHTEALGALDRPIRTAAQLHALAVSPHVYRLVTTAYQLGQTIPGLHRLHRWAYQLGYGGHWLTKSRRWSTTFAALRAARREHNDQRDGRTPPQGEVIAAWTYVASGYRLTGDHEQAQQLRAYLEWARREARHQLAQQAASVVAA